MYLLIDTIVNTLNSIDMECADSLGKANKEKDPIKKAFHQGKAEGYNEVIERLQSAIKIAFELKDEKNQRSIKLLGKIGFIRKEVFDDERSGNH